MLISRLLILLIIVFTTPSLSLAQASENLSEWLKLKVFVNTREDVEKVYGKGEDFALGKLYQTPEGNVYVQYSGGENCTSSTMTIWNVVEGKITELDYSPSKNPPKLKELGLNKSGFKKRQYGTDVPDHIEFYNDEKGISVIYDKSIKEIINIIIRPSNKDKLKYSCDVKMPESLRK